MRTPKHKWSMLILLLVLLTFRVVSADETPLPAQLGLGNHSRSLMLGERKRTYLFHVLQGYDPKKPTPVVLALHRAAMNGPMMVWFSGLNKTSVEKGFIGKSAKNISANDLIWEFFEKHPME